MFLAQGPLPVTCFDTWRMAWQFKSRAIIMLNKLIEQGKNKCHRYWPEEIGSTLTFKGMEQKNDLYFTISLKGNSEVLQSFKFNIQLNKIFKLYFTSVCLS